MSNRPTVYEVKTAELNTMQDYMFVVIFAKYNGKWIFCRHKERTTYETAGGRIEHGESCLQAAKRELYEETGAIDFEITPLFDYSVNSSRGLSNGQVYFAEVKKLGKLPESEIALIEFFDEMPTALTHPDIQPILFTEIKEMIKDENLTTDNYLENYYINYDEDGRLINTRHGQVEYLTTMRYIEKYLFSGAKILEVGAGTGRYSLALADKGYTVDAVELVQHNVDIFQNKIENKSITIQQGDARDLSAFKDNEYDLVLVLGPLYHLFSKEDKQKVISEALRVAKKGGIVFAAYCIADYSILYQGFARKRFDIADYIKQGLIDHAFKATSKPSLFFDILRREDIDDIMIPFNFMQLHYVATDLYSSYISEQLMDMTEKEFALYLDYHFSICERQDMVGITSHSLDIFKKK